MGDEATLTEPATRPWRVLRMDDNGNEFEVARASSRGAAEALAREMESRGLKQMYWVARA